MTLDISKVQVFNKFEAKKLAYLTDCPENTAQQGYPIFLSSDSLLHGQSTQKGRKKKRN